MKNFLIKFLFFSIPISIFGIFCGISIVVEWHYFKKAVRCPDATVAIVGNSRPQCDVNEKFFPGLVNFSQRATPSPVWKAKLGIQLAENPQIEKLIIEISPWFYFTGANGDMYSRLEFVRGFLPEVVVFDVFRHKDVGGFEWRGLFRRVVKGAFWPFVQRCVSRTCDSRLQEGYFALDNVITDTQWWKQGARSSPMKVDVPLAKCTAVRSDLEEMILMAKRRKIDCVLMTLPSLGIVDKQTFTCGEQEYFRNEMDSICRKFSVKWIDYSGCVQELSKWADNGHLNRGGQRSLRRYCIVIF